VAYRHLRDYFAALKAPAAHLAQVDARWAEYGLE